VLVQPPGVAIEVRFARGTVHDDSLSADGRAFGEHQTLSFVVRTTLGVWSPDREASAELDGVATAQGHRFLAGNQLLHGIGHVSELGITDVGTRDHHDGPAGVELEENRNRLVAIEGELEFDFG